MLRGIELCYINLLNMETTVPKIAFILFSRQSWPERTWFGLERQSEAINYMVKLSWSNMLLPQETLSHPTNPSSSFCMRHASLSECRPS